MTNDTKPNDDESRTETEEMDDNATAPSGRTSGSSPGSAKDKADASEDDADANEDHAPQQPPPATTTMSRFLGLWGRSPVSNTQNDDLNDLDEFELARQSLSFTSPHEADSDDDRPTLDFLQDDPATMTYARRMALSLMQYQWYYPQQVEDQDDTDANNKKAPDQSPAHYATSGTPLVAGGTIRKPNLARAWAYFEHVALPRYIVEEKDPTLVKKNIVHRAFRKVFCKANKDLHRAEPGEKRLKTSLYSAIFTPLSQMGDWGIGVGLYFSTLRSVTILMLLAGLLNLVNILYFGSHSYDANEQAGVSPNFVKGSAICTDTAWVPCVNCNADDFSDHRIANGTAQDGDATVVFALRNLCDGATLEQGMISYGTLWLVIIGIVGMNYYQRLMEIKFDEDEQTAQDYSIVITNPPHDATDPNEWKEFLESSSFGNTHVAACTVALDNDFLVRSLVERRECMRKIELILEPGTPLDTLTLARMASQTERDRTLLQRIIALLAPGLPELFSRVTVLTARIQGLSQVDYPCSNVFVTFETEAAQRRVLSELSVGSLVASRNKTTAVPPHCLFRNEHVLAVKEPDEPSTVRWQDLNVKWFAKFKQIFYTSLASVAAIILIAFIIRLIHGRSAAFAAIAIAIFNSIFPLFAKILTSLEQHAAEGNKQTSLYFKIAAFRWVNTAIVITIITPFTETTEESGLINSIYAIFFAEIVTTNAIQLLDPMGHIQRHFLAPRAATQDLMDLKMQGQEFELAERYTNMTKILFLAVWYCSIFPAALFLCAFALFVNYFTDRFALMRTWKRPPQLGTRISKFSRRYFFSTAMVAMAIVTAYYWSGFPYDNLCENDSTVADQLNGQSLFANSAWTITPASASHNTTTTLVSPSDATYRYCLQDLLRTQGKNFPAVPRFQPEGDEWMTEDQETVTSIYGWTSVAVLGIVALNFLWGWVAGLEGFVRGTYMPSGEDQGIHFSDVPSISTYVPQVASTVYAYPLLACNIDNIDEELFDWTDPSRPYAFYDLTKDADALLAGLDIGENHVFSVLVHWPPEKEDPPGAPAES